MAELLKNKYPLEVAKTIGGMIVKVYPEFDSTGFIKHVAKGYEQLELMDRGRKISAALKVFLPDNFKQAVTILLASLDSPYEQDPENSLASFIFMPHTMFVTENGLDDFDTSMAAHYQLTQRFTSEFAIRPFIERYPEQSLGLLKQWAVDANYHVRRLVSEATRTRLPWASRLPEFIKDPSPVVELLEQLKDDTELYVRRSVANNLNDIGKDHPQLLANLATAWLVDAPKDRVWLVKHALRSAIKRGEPGALKALGYSKNLDVKVTSCDISPKKCVVGSSVIINFTLHNQSQRSAALMVDFAVHFVKANGNSNPKVFKLKAIELAANQSMSFSKKVSLKPMTTRTLYAGLHKVEAIVNGDNTLIGSFELVE